jgi:hypothetical protein
MSFSGSNDSFGFGSSLGLSPFLTTLPSSPVSHPAGALPAIFLYFSASPAEAI